MTLKFNYFRRVLKSLSLARFRTVQFTDVLLDVAMVWKTTHTHNQIQPHCLNSSDCLHSAEWQFTAAFCTSISMAKGSFLISPWHCLAISKEI